LAAEIRVKNEILDVKMRFDGIRARIAKDHEKRLAEKIIKQQKEESQNSQEKKEEKADENKEQ